jgi:hypothetical protein
MRGSRKHVLSWTGSPTFATELLAMASPVRCTPPPSQVWMPKGFDAPKEARLETFGETAIPNHPAWTHLRRWWLRHERGANTPNWDIAFRCDIDAVPGLILVEAKANEPELSDAGKWVWTPSSKRKEPSSASRENHAQIETAIEEARFALDSQYPDTRISTNYSYQLSNRIAFAWKLATLGVPTVLIYLGFTGDGEIASVGRPFSSASDWDDHFDAHLRKVAPGLPREQRIDTEASPFWLLSRSRAA